MMCVFLYLLGAVVCASFINRELGTMLDDNGSTWAFIAPWWVVLIVAILIACWPIYILIRAIVYLYMSVGKDS